MQRFFSKLGLRHNSFGFSFQFHISAGRSSLFKASNEKKKKMSYYSNSRSWTQKKTFSFIGIELNLDKKFFEQIDQQ